MSVIILWSLCLRAFQFKNIKNAQAFFKLLTQKIHNGPWWLAIYLLLFSNVRNDSAPARWILFRLLGMVLLCNSVLMKCFYSSLMLIYLIEMWGMWWWWCCGEGLLLFHLTNGVFFFCCLNRERMHRDVGFRHLDLHANRSSQGQ